MQTSLVLGVGATIAALAVVVSSLGHRPVAPVPPAPPIAAGHYVLVVEGDRQLLTITHAVAKADAWAGVNKGFASSWRLSIRDERGALLAEVPLDVTPFATGAADLGKPARVEGCVVRDSRIAMLVNVPRFAAPAASYTFTREEGTEAIPLGMHTGEQVRALAGEVR